MNTYFLYGRKNEQRLVHRASQQARAREYSLGRPTALHLLTPHSQYEYAAHNHIARSQTAFLQELFG